MCLSCGCKVVDADHGNSANFTLRDLEEAARAADITPEQALENIRQTYSEKVTAAGGRTSRPTM